MQYEGGTIMNVAVTVNGAELSEKEQKTLISNYIQDNFTKEILKFGFENEFLFRDKGNGIEDIIENIPNFLLKKNITSFDNIKEQLHSNNNKTKVNQKFNSFLTNIILIVLYFMITQFLYIKKNNT